jgi:ABC-2 type transport system ATP-binding protein
MSAPAIQVDAVAKSYGATVALKGVSLTIPRGEFFGLLGPNGAGKSTLISIISGLTRLDAGTVKVLGHDTVREYRAARRQLGVVPQELVFDPFFTVREVLRIQAGYYGCGRDSWPWIEELLARLDLAGKATATIRQLSGGMKRRVLIAQALVHKPPVVILDEPTAGVDVELRRTLWKFTRELHAQGTTVVLTTHYLEEAEELCSRIAILDKGEVKALEPTRDILSRHPFRMLKLRIEGRAALPPALAAFVTLHKGEDLELKLKRDEQPLGDVLDALRTAGLRVLDVKTREPSLEDVFLDLTRKAA